MTKTQYRQYKTEWAAALAAGRVVVIDGGGMAKSFPTLAQRDAWIAELEAAEIPYRIAEAR